MTFKAVGNGAIQELVYVSAPPPHTIGFALDHTGCKISPYDGAPVLAMKLAFHFVFLDCNSVRHTLKYEQYNGGSTPVFRCNLIGHLV